MAVSQSNTMWVKKGTVVNGKKVTKGYVAQKGKPEKRVTNKIKLVVDTDKRGKAGETVQTKKGRYVKSNKKVQVTKPKSKGGGYTGSGPAGGKSAVRTTTAPPPKKPDKGKTDKPAKDTTTKDTGYENKGDRKATSATVSSAKPKASAPKPSLGGENKKFTPGRDEPGQNKGNAKPKSRLDKVGERGPIGTAADAAKSAGKGASKWLDKYGPNSEWATGKKSKKPIKIGSVRMMGNPPKKHRRTKNGWMLVK